MSFRKKLVDSQLTYANIQNTYLFSLRRNLFYAVQYNHPNENVRIPSNTENFRIQSLPFRMSLKLIEFVRL